MSRILVLIACFFLTGSQSNVSNFLFVSKNSGYSQVYLYQNGVKKKLTSESNNRRPKLSPNGKTILFESDRDGRYQIYSINIDGTAEKNISNNKYNEGGANWSSDGKYIAFYSNRDGDDEIYIREITSGKITQLTHNNYNDWRPSFSKDGKYIVFSAELSGTNEEVFKIHIATKKVTRLTKNNVRDGWVSFDKTGNKILFHSERTGRMEIWEMSSDGKNQRQLTNFKGDAFKPCYVYRGMTITGILYSSEEDYHNDWDIKYFDFAKNEVKKIINSNSRDYEPHYFSY